VQIAGSRANWSNRANTQPPSSGGPTCRPLFFMSWAVLRGRAGMHADGGPATFSFLTLRSMAGPRWPQGGEDLRIS